MKKFLRVAGLIGLFVGSFLLFTVMMFPYEVLKEAISSQLSKELGFNVHISKLSPAFPLGMEMENITVASPRGGASMSLKEVTLHVSLLSLLTGKIGPRFELRQDKGGYIAAGANIGIIGALTGEALPRKVFLDSKEFVLDDIFRFLMAWQASLPETNPLLVGLLNDLTMSGSLNADLALDINQSNIAGSDGKLVLNLKNAALKLGNADLAIKDQVLEKAFISATMRQGELAFDENSGLKSDGLEVLINGKVILKPNFFDSVLEMLVDLKIKQEIKDNYGFIMDAVTQRTSNGEVKIQIRGPLTTASIVAM